MTDLQGGPAAKPEILRYLRESESSVIPWENLTSLRLETRRQALQIRGPLEDVHSVHELAVGDARVRLYRPAGADANAFVWVHGGGWVHGDLDGYDGVARALANRAGCSVLAVDYRLAPENPFPAALQDVQSVTAWASEHFDLLAIGGDSAGGNLAAATCLAGGADGVALALQLLVYPVLDHGPSLYKQVFEERYERFAGRPSYGTEACQRIAWLWDQYDPNRQHRDNPLAAPLRAEYLGDVPPAVFILAEHDVLRGEAEMYATRLQEAGVPVSVHSFAGQIHGFFQMVDVTPDANHALELAGDAIQSAFAHTSTPRAASTRRPK